MSSKFGDYIRLLGANRAVRVDEGSWSVLEAFIFSKFLQAKAPILTTLSKQHLEMLWKPVDIWSFIKFHQVSSEISEIQWRYEDHWRSLICNEEIIRNWRRFIRLIHSAPVVRAGAFSPGLRGRRSKPSAWRNQRNGTTSNMSHIQYIQDIHSKYKIRISIMIYIYCYTYIYVYDYTYIYVYDMIIHIKIHIYHMYMYMFITFYNFRIVATDP